ncbi:hypothetical protein FEDK69T_28720 [Flavobacterium enshiense DK69]|nr:hypothetical protein FEDK69T_28720 [Flavobacterium enshiense DK69]
MIAKSTEYTLSNANKAYLPHISITGIGGYIIGGLPTVSGPGQLGNEPSKFQLIGIGQINQTIWDGGATRSQKDIAKASAEVEKASVDVSLYSIQERVNQIYFGILLIDAQLKQLEILTENLNLNLKKVKLSKENGLAYQTDVDEVKAEVLNVEQKKIEFYYTRKGYVEMLSLLIGEKLNDYVKLETPLISNSAENMNNNRPELNLYANQLKLAEAQSSMNKVNNMPKIGLLGAGILLEPGIAFGASDFNSLAVVGLSASWNTDGIFRSSNNKNLDKIRMEKITNQQETFLFNNKLELNQASSAIEKQKAIITKDDEIIRLKTAIKKGYLTKYDAGMCSMNDVINAVNKESEALSNRDLHNIQLLMSLYDHKTINGN